jgi:hypothetical protein
LYYVVLGTIWAILCHYGSQLSQNVVVACALLPIYAALLFVRVPFLSSAFSVDVKYKVLCNIIALLLDIAIIAGYWAIHELQPSERMVGSIFWILMISSLPFGYVEWKLLD